IRRAVSENHTVKSIISGRIEEVFVKENQPVQAGQVLARVKADVLEQERVMLSTQQQDLLNQLADLQKLTGLVSRRAFSERPTLVSPIYSQQFTFFWQKIRSEEHTSEL